MNKLSASASHIAAAAASVPAEKGEKPAPPVALDIPATLSLTREQLTALRAGAAEIRATVTVKRATTGAEEVYNLILRPQAE